MILVRVALSNLLRAVHLLATALFALSVVGTLVACGVYFWYDTDFWYYFDVGVVLKITVLLLSGFVVSSGLLFWHCQRQESYMTFESLFFLVCLELPSIGVMVGGMVAPPSGSVSSLLG